MNLLKLIHPESLDDAKEHFRKTVETGEAEGIVSFVKKTGEKGYWNVRAVRLDDTSFIGFVSDVTDLLMSQEALRKSEEEKSLILNATKESIVYYDRDLRINWINRAMSKRLGVEVGDLIGKKCFMIWKAGEKCDDCILEKVIKSREQKKTELTNEMGEYWLVRAYPVIGPDGDVTGVVEVSEDITERKRASKKLEAAFDALVRIASDIVSAKDPYTAGHQKNVSDLAVAIGKKMGLNYETLTCLKFAGLLHDIGKISIPSEILTRPVKLSNIELSLIKEHSRNGYNILKDIDLPWPIADIVLQHHERLDGSGYPNGLKNDEIRLESRIIAVADVVEAITSHRPYRQALGIEHALNEIKKNSGILYDPAVVEACVQVFEDGYLLTV